MKTILTLALLSLCSVSALAAKPLDTIDKARAVKEQMSEAVMSLPGVNGYGISGCDPLSGEQFMDQDFVHCIVIYAETEAGLKLLQGLYPSPTLIQGVFVTVQFMGPVIPQPRMSGGN